MFQNVGFWGHDYGLPTSSVTIYELFACQITRRYF
jgi:hypothetical protein